MVSSVAQLEEFGKDMAWFLRQYGELLKFYEGEWVAIYKEGVADHDSNLTKLLEKLRTRGLRPEAMVIEFVTKEPIEAIL